MHASETRLQDADGPDAIAPDGDETACQREFEARSRPGGLDEALPLAERCAAAVKQRVGPEHPDYAIALFNLMDLLASAPGRGAETQALNRTARDIFERAMAAEPSNANWPRSLVKICERLVTAGDAPQANMEKALAAARLMEANGQLAPWEKDWPGNLERDLLRAVAQHLDKTDRFDDALVVAERLAKSVEQTEASEGPSRDATARALNNLSWLALMARQPKKALAASERALSLAPDKVWLAANRAHALMFLGNAEEARAAYLKHKGESAYDPLGAGAALVGHKRLPSEKWEIAVASDFSRFRQHGLDHPQMAEIETALRVADNPLVTLRQARELVAEGRTAEALALNQNYIEKAKARFGEISIQHASLLENFALRLPEMGRPDLAEDAAKRALAIIEELVKKGSGPKESSAPAPNPPPPAALDELKLVDPLSMLASVYENQGRVAEAEPLAVRALGICENTTRSDQEAFSCLSRAGETLARIYARSGRRQDARQTAARIVTVAERKWGLDHLGLARLLQDLASASDADERARINERIVDIYDKAIRSGRPDADLDSLYETKLISLAERYLKQGQLAEAERALKLAIKSSGSASACSSLLDLYKSQKRYAEIEEHYKSLVFEEERYRSPTGCSGNQLDAYLEAEKYYRERQNSTAVQNYQRLIVKARERRLSSWNHEWTRIPASGLDDLAKLYVQQNRFSDAEAALKRALEFASKRELSEAGGIEKRLAQLKQAGRDQRDKSCGTGRLDILATIDSWQSHEAQMRELCSEQDWRMLRDLANPMEDRLLIDRDNEQLRSEQYGRAGQVFYERSDWANSASLYLRASELLDQAIRHMGTKGANPTITNSSLAKKEENPRLNFVKAAYRLARSDEARAQEFMGKAFEMAQRAQHAAANYAAFADPEPLGVAQVQELLRPDEAVVLFLEAPEKTLDVYYVWAIARSQVKWERIEFGQRFSRDELKAMAPGLRCGMDPANWVRGSANREECERLKGGNPQEKLLLLAIKDPAGDRASLHHGEDSPQLDWFDASEAYELYEKLFGQVADVIADKRLLIVPDGPLTQTPFHALVTERPKSKSGAAGSEGLTDVRWLAGRQPLSMLPSMASLAALRQTDPSQASQASGREAAAQTPWLVSARWVIDSGGHQGLVRSVIVTRDGKQVVSGGEDKVIRVWNAATGETVRTIRTGAGQPVNGRIYALALSADERWLAAAGLITTPRQGRDKQKDEQKAEGKEQGEAPAFGQAHVIQLYDFQTGRLAATLPNHLNVIEALAFSPDGRLLASASLDGTVRLWNMAERRETQSLSEYAGPIFAIGFSPDGARVAAGGADNKLRLWNAASGELIATMAGHRDKVSAIAVSPTDGVIASASADGEIRLWDGLNGKFLKTLANQSEEVGALRFSPDGRRLLSTCGRPQRSCLSHIWEAATGKSLVTHAADKSGVTKSPDLAAAFSPDGLWAASGGGADDEIHLWDARTGKTLKTLRGGNAGLWADGRSDRGLAIAWDTLFDLKVIARRGLPAQRLHLNPKGEQPPPGARAPENAGVRTLTTHGALSFAIRKGGSYDGDAILDILKHGKPIASLVRDAASGLEHRAYTFTAGGDGVITGGVDGSLTAYDLSGRRLGAFAGHEGAIYAVAPSRDGRYLVSSAADHTVRLWNARTRELIASALATDDGQWIVWTPQGFYACSPEADHLLGWRLDHGPERGSDDVAASQLRRHLNRPAVVIRAIELASAEAAAREPSASGVKLLELLSKPGPKLRIASPAPGAVTAGGTAELRVEVAEPPYSVKLIRVEVNGRAVAQLSPRSGPSLAPGEHVFRIPLDREVNRVTVTGANETAETVESVTLTRKDDSRRTTASSFDDGRH